MRAASLPVSFSLRRLASAMLCRARPTRLLAACLLFTVTLVTVPKEDISGTSFDEGTTATNEIVVETAASSWQHRRSVTAFVPRIFAQTRRTIFRRIGPVYAGQLTDARTVREFLCSFLC